MSTKEPFEIPDGMRRVCRRFERWRNGHKARLPIPEGLWAAAAEAAREHGVFRASKALHLEYGKLKRMVEAGPAPAPPTMAPARFLELAPPLAVGLAECLIEVEGPRGKMRIQWKGDARRTWPDSAGCCGSRRDSDHAADAHPGGDRGRGWTEGHRFPGSSCARRNSRADPFSGCLFVFRSRRGTSIRILVYDGQGFWLAQKAPVAKDDLCGGRSGEEPAGAGSAPGAVAVGGR